MDSARIPPAALGDRRAGERRPSSAPLRITLEHKSFEGVSDNLSEAGVFFTSPERLRVRVELEVDGVLREFRGALVRVQRMSAESTGYAIEFDREPGVPSGR
jgi:hypothetical protein